MVEDKRKTILAMIFNSARVMKDYFHGNVSECKCSNPNPLHLETMRYVLEKENPSMKDLANHLCITPASASALIDSLVETRMIKRTLEKDDRRIVRLAITENGKKKFKETEDLLFGKMKEIFKEMSDRDIENMHNALESFINIVNNKKKLK